MKIGLTYDLRSEYLALGYGEEETAEFDCEDTIEALETTIQSLGYQTQRIGSIKNLIHHLSTGNSWDLVFNICEGLQGEARESQVPAILDAFKIPYTFSDPLVLAIALDKYACKSYLEKFGIPTPGFALLQKESQLKNLDLNFPLFLKPVAEGTGKGVYANSKVENETQMLDQYRFLKKQFQQPILVEEYLPGREFTVAIVGNGRNANVLGTMEIFFRDSRHNAIYSYETKENCETEIIYQPGRDALAKQAEKVALKAYRALGCKDVGRVDIRTNRFGKPEFIEINPIPGIHPQHSDLPMIATQEGISYRELLQRIISSAIGRYKHLQLIKVA
ncbi:MAG: ATP-grasp domain-containing protein [Candidatus Cloacimonadales bacterium]|nr:ATP-grasp domain-containing protein [Candidatus Cloacimonadales bacterium]